MKSKRFLIIGLDGGTFDVINPFVKEGLLPNIAKVMEHGCYGILESTIPPVTAPAWASFLTGKNPGKHGILHFYEFSKNERQIAYTLHTGKFLNLSHIKESTMFELLGENGKKVISINIPMTYPPREIKGKMISCWLTPPGAKDYTYPPSLREEYTEYRIDQYFGEKIFALVPAGKKIIADEFFHDINDVLDKRAKTALSMIDKETWDLFMVCFTETDRVHHFFWRAINPQHSESDIPIIQKERGLFIDFYKKLDGYIGELIDWAERRDAIVCILSDHGFGPPPSKWLHMNYYLRKKGYLITHHKNYDEPSAFLTKIGKWMWQYKMGRILLRDLLRLQIKTSWGGEKNDVDWRHTKAWSVCLINNVGGIFFNLESIKVPIEEFRSRLISEMLSIVDPENGRWIVQKVWLREELFSGDKMLNFPDLIYFLDPNYAAGVEGMFDLFTNSLISNTGSERGNHNTQGIYLFYGKDIKTDGITPPKQILDILPTILFYLGIPIPDDLDGKPALDIFRESFISNKEPIYKTIKPLSYRSVKENQKDQEASDDEVAIQEKLKNLGYL